MMIAKIEIIDGRLLLSKGQRERESARTCPKRRQPTVEVNIKRTTCGNTSINYSFVSLFAVSVSFFKLRASLAWFKSPHSYRFSCSAFVSFLDTEKHVTYMILLSFLQSPIEHSIFFLLAVPLLPNLVINSSSGMNQLIGTYTTTKY